MVYDFNFGRPIVRSVGTDTNLEATFANYEAENQTLRTELAAVKAELVKVRAECNSCALLIGYRNALASSQEQVRVLRVSCQQLFDAMREYDREQESDYPVPFKHSEMMRSALATLASTEEGK
jgi:Skp family chaperone for outer membrane proteins